MVWRNERGGAWYGAAGGAGRGGQAGRPARGAKTSGGKPGVPALAAARRWHLSVAHRVAADDALGCHVVDEDLAAAIGKFGVDGDAVAGQRLRRDPGAHR